MFKYLPYFSTSIILHDFDDYYNYFDYYSHSGDVHDAYPFFASTGNNCPRNYNPSDFFLDVLSPDSRNTEVI